MFYDIDESVRRKAKTPHEISMFNLMFFNLLLGAGTVVMALIGVELMEKVGNWGFALPLSASLAVVAFIHLRAMRASGHEPWFVAVHWQLAKRRTRLLLIGYAITITIIGAALLVASGADKYMQDIAETATKKMPEFDEALKPQKLDEEATELVLYDEVDEEAVLDDLDDLLGGE